MMVSSKNLMLCDSNIPSGILRIRIRDVYITCILISSLSMCHRKNKITYGGGNHFPTLRKNIQETKTTQV